MNLRFSIAIIWFTVQFLDIFYGIRGTFNVVQLWYLQGALEKMVIFIEFQMYNS